MPTPKHCASAPPPAPIHREPINGFQDAWRQSLQSAKPFQMLPLPLFAAMDGGTTQHFVTGGHLWATAMQKGSPERIKELLRIMNRRWRRRSGARSDRLLTFGLPNSDQHVGRGRATRS